MLIYHVTSATYKNNWQEALQGENATKPGRWSSPGTAMIYASSHLTLATLEALVHCDENSLRIPRITLRFEVDEGSLEVLPLEALPEDWNALPESESTKRIGDAWARNCKHLGLIVPTATLLDGRKVQEKNILLNPKYPRFFEYLGEPDIESFRFDSRLEELVTGG
jgi:RES domain-containing protein